MNTLDEVRETAYRRRIHVEAPTPQMVVHSDEPQIVEEEDEPDTQMVSTRFRQRINFELSRIESVLAATQLEDAMTVGIRSVHVQFKEAMRLERLNPQAIFNEFVLLFQDLLKDAIYEAPLGKKPKLGSDSETYGCGTLSFYLATVPEEERDKLPLDFTIQPHPVAKAIVKWLDSHGCLLHDVEKENAFQELKAQNRRPILPRQESEEFRSIRQRALQRQRRAANRREGLLVGLEANRMARARHIQQIVLPIRDQIEEAHQDNLEREELERQIEEQVEEQMVNIEQAIERLGEENARLEQRLEDVANQIEADPQRRVAALQDRIESRRNRIVGRLDDLNRELQELEEENVEDVLQIDNEATDENVEAAIDILEEHERQNAQARQVQVTTFEEELRVTEENNTQDMLQELGALHNEVLDETERSNRRLINFQEQDQIQAQQHREDIGILRDQVATAEAGTEELIQQQWQVEKEILKTREELLKAKIALAKAKKAIKKAKKNQSSGLIKMGIKVAISTATTWGMSELIPMAQPMINPLSGGGFELGGSFIF